MKRKETQLGLHPQFWLSSQYQPYGPPCLLAPTSGPGRRLPRTRGVVSLSRGPQWPVASSSGYPMRYSSNATTSCARISRRRKYRTRLSLAHLIGALVRCRSSRPRGHHHRAHRELPPPLHLLVVAQLPI